MFEIRIVKTNSNMAAEILMNGDKIGHIDEGQITMPGYKIILNSWAAALDWTRKTFNNVEVINDI